MQLQRNWNRPPKVDMSNRELDYSDKYEYYPRAFKGEVFKHVRIANAFSQIVSFKKDKNDANSQKKYVEKLELVFIIDEKYWYRDTIWGARKKDDGTWGANPEALQDFLYLCEYQLPHSTERSIDFETDWGDTQTVYPNICGQHFTLIVAKNGEREYKNKTYDKNSFQILSDKGFSAVELEFKQEKPTFWKDCQEELQKQYKKWADKNEIRPQNDGNPYGALENAPQSTYYNEFENPSKEAIAANADVPPADDLPF